MRWLIVAITITAATAAHAEDGYYLTESFGGGAYRGELSRYDGAPRFQIGGGVRRGAWSVEAFGTFLVPDFGYIDCYGAECAYAAKPQAGLGAFGMDLRRRWRLTSVPRRPGYAQRPGVFMALHGGARWYVADDALEGYQGLGLGGGAAIECDLLVIGFFLDFGLDVMRLEGPNETIHGSTPYVMLGAKLGWL
jgi:hypothetical protein